MTDLKTLTIETRWDHGTVTVWEHSAGARVVFVRTFDGTDEGLDEVFDAAADYVRNNARETVIAGRRVWLCR